MTPFKSCYNCPDREVGCHSYCEKYIQDKARHDKIREKVEVEKKTELYFRDVAAKNFDQSLKKREQHHKYARRRKK